jgi:peptidoglycan/LPS O-acetylase OafA/YrhL
MSHSQYRPDIDGLRSIAVLAVFVHHLNASLLPGGFVGVDLFFVISGFLITSQVYAEIRSHTFVFKHFYQRRINRILPALVTVLLVTVIAGGFILSPADLTQLNLSALFSLLGVSNIYIAMKHGNYFATDAHEAPLVHSWSLGIEEQFYLIWPLFILGLYRLAPRYVLPLLGVGLVVALSASEYATSLFPTASYYLLPTRFFELMLGGALGVYLSQPRQLYKQVVVVYAATGYGLIIFSLFALNPDTPFPGLIAFIPCLGAALLILAGHSDRSRLLTNRPMVFIGLISYSLYLWHWPLIAYLNYLDVDITLPVGISLMGVAISLSWCSWRYIEVPFRRSGLRLPFSRVVARRFLAPALGLAVLTGLSVQFQGFPQRFVPQVATLEAMTKVEPHKLRSGCHMPNERSSAEPDPDCRLGAHKAQLDGIMVGDSFANHFTGMVDILAESDDIRLMDYTLDSCPPIFGHTVEVSAMYGDRCMRRNQRVFELIEQNHYAYVVLAGVWPRGATDGALVEASIKQVTDNAGKVIVILSNQNITHAATCPVRRLMFGAHGSCSAPLDITAPYWSAVRAKLPQVHFIDPNRVICPAGLCSPIIDGQLLYRDDAHLNDVGSRFIGRTLRNQGFSLLQDPVEPGPIATMR